MRGKKITLPEPGLPLGRHPLEPQPLDIPGALVPPHHPVAGQHRALVQPAEGRGV